MVKYLLIITQLISMDLRFPSKISGFLSGFGLYGKETITVKPHTHSTFSTSFFCSHIS